MKWIYYNPLFESEEVLKDVDSSWGGHRYFAYDLVSNFRPQTIVELGTYKGTSFFAFCQAVKDRKFGCDLFAVDSWKGDLHSNLYGEEVFQLFNEVKAKYYPALSTRAFRMNFDDAAGEFADHSIDILHIDGYHTYEAVSHDFDRWFGKVKENGIILFHDTHEIQQDFGVYKFWDELKTKYGTLEFYHSHGLGVLFRDPGMQEEFSACGDAWQKYYALQDSFMRSEQAAQMEISALKKVISDLDQDRANLNQYIQDKEDIIREKETIIRGKENIIRGKEDILKENEDRLIKKRHIIQEKDNHLKEKEGIIREKENVIKKIETIIRDKDNHIDEKEKTIQALRGSLSWKLTAPVRWLAGILQKRGGR